MLCLRGEVGEEDVGVADVDRGHRRTIGASRRSGSLQSGSRAAERPEVAAEAACRHPGLVHGLDVVGEPERRIEGHQLLQRAGDGDADELGCGS